MVYRTAAEVDEAPAVLARELVVGEDLVWWGRPRRGIKLRSSDAFLIPFSLVWFGFALYWEIGVLRTVGLAFSVFVGLPFVVIGAYLSVGRHVLDARRRARTFYGLTTDRALIVSGGRTRRVHALELSSSPQMTVVEHRDRSGTLVFGSFPPGDWSNATVPQFEFIDDVKTVYHRARALQLAASTDERAA